MKTKKRQNPEINSDSSLSYVYDLRNYKRLSTARLFILYLLSLRRPRTISNKHSIEYFSYLKNCVAANKKLSVTQIGIDGSDYDPHLFIGDRKETVKIGNKSSIYKVQGGVVMLDNPSELRYLAYSNFIMERNVQYNAFVLKDNNDFEIYSLNPRYNEMLYGRLAPDQRTLFDKKMDEILNPKKYRL